MKEPDRPPRPNIVIVRPARVVPDDGSPERATLLFECSHVTSWTMAGKIREWTTDIDIRMYESRSRLDAGLQWIEQNDFTVPGTPEQIEAERRYRMAQHTTKPIMDGLVRKFGFVVERASDAPHEKVEVATEW